MKSVLPLLENTDFPSLRRESLDTLQVNIGYRCNLSCSHCHVGSSPSRTEMMTDDNLDLIVEVLEKRPFKTLDLTGGAPEIHEGFKGLVRAATERGVHVIDRCNLTILLEPGQEDTAQFLADHKVEVVASLPCYSLDNVDAQRGDGVFEGSIEALKRLNALGYGQPGSDLVLNLVYNPQGASLPPEQGALEADYKRELREHFGIEFNQLFTITNMPIKRFGSMLRATHQFDAYMDLLKSNHSAANLPHVMCRSQVSVDWQGYLYDCDFNQMLELPMPSQGFSEGRPHLRDLLTSDAVGQPIVVADHCYGCTAGSGSSCGGALESH
ncbi:MAG: arsenosugar biosynthesis radical SAM (seleno)protein ArsS [Pseudomonadota bacterium]